MTSTSASASPALLAVAERIGMRLCRDAFWHGRACTWLGWSVIDEGDDVVPVYRSFGPDLYRGTSGIALFLTRLFAHTPEPVIRETLLGALAQALETVHELEPDVAVGAYTGRAGVAHAALVAGAQLDHAPLIEAGLALLSSLATVELRPELFDVITGVAGVVPLLLDAAATHQRAQLVDIALAFGDHLVEHARSMPIGRAWGGDPAKGQRPLCGYSHGVAGVVLALAELHAVTGHARHAEAAAAALAYERSYFHAPSSNWHDLRRAEEPRAAPGSCGWCHGAPGIGLARLRMLELGFPDDRLRAEVEAALTATLTSLGGPQQPPLGNDSLCHGGFGNADLLIEAGLVLARPQLLSVARALAEQRMRAVEARGLAWPSGGMDWAPTPGLMLGEAGVGLAYLRAHDPQATPSACRLGGRRGRSRARNLAPTC